MSAPVTVRAAVLREPGLPVSIEEISLADPRSDQVRVRITATGVCHSDLSLANGTMPYPTPVVLGHEAAGVVVETGADVKNVRAGDRVLLAWNPACRNCFFCDRGEPFLCENAIRDFLKAPYAVDGAGERLNCGFGVASFATETLVSERSVVPLPDHVSDEVAAVIGCAVATGVGAALNTAQVQPGSTVAVIGCGPVGMCVIQGARIAGAERIIAADLSAERLSFARSFGATETVDASGAVVDEIKHLTGGRGADYVFEVVGRSATVRAAYEATRRGGTTVVVGLGSPTDTAAFSSFEIVFDAKQLVGCFYGSTDPLRDYPRLIEMYADGRLDLDRLITGRISLDEVGDAFTAMEQGVGARSVILPS